jgi:hypothetical protein
MNTRASLHSLLFIVLFILQSGCALTSHYGPYKGKVVDGETSSPIEGAVVLIQFFQLPLKDVAKDSGYYDVIEGMTDALGEFNISTPGSWHKSMAPSWDKVHVTVFKPGYGTFPRHPQTSPNFSEDDSFPQAEQVSISLPRLATLAERKKNLEYTAFAEPSSPKNKQMPEKFKIKPENVKNLLRLRDVEKKAVGQIP